MKNALKITPVILAGGSGTRLWPISRKSMPKQFCKIAGEKSLFQTTLLRVANNELFNPPIVISGADHKQAIEIQLKEVGIDVRAIICEPVGRDTAAAIALAANLFEERDEDVMLVLPSDHHIEDEDKFEQLVQHANYVAADGKSIITFGIKPTHPDTGFGYIRAGKKHGSLNVHDLDIFIEKPDLELAEKLIQDECIFWNAGIFMFHPSLMRDELKNYAPDLFLKIKTSICHGTWVDLTFHPDRWIFEGITPISFDYAIMEKTEHAVIAKADINWSDMGSWDAVWGRNDRDQQNNSLIGETYCEDTNDSLIVSDGPAVAVSGLKDIIVIAQNDAVLVTSRDQSQCVKKLVEQIRPQNIKLLMQHKTRAQPWGEIEALHECNAHQVAVIKVESHREISNENHHKNQKSWFVKSGYPFLINNGRLVRLAPNQHVEIDLDSDFTLQNCGDESVEIIEVSRAQPAPSSSFEYHPNISASIFTKTIRHSA